MSKRNFLIVLWAFTVGSFLLFQNCSGSGPKGSAGGGLRSAWTGVRQMGAATGDTQLGGVTTDPAGNVIIAGSTSGRMNGHSLTGINDLYVTKYDLSGNILWSQQMGVASSLISVSAVAADSSGFIYVVGATNVALGSTAQAGINDLFVIKYDYSGTQIWTQQLGVSHASTWGTAVTTDSSGNIFIAGSTTGGLDGNALTGASDMFVSKYNSSGARQWTQQLGVAQALTQAKAITLSATGSVLIAGSTAGGLDGNTLTGSVDLFLTKYDTTGANQWTRQLGAAAVGTAASGVATDPTGGIYLAGWTQGSVNGNALNGTTDLLMVKYDDSGNLQWSQQMGAAACSTLGAGVSVDAQGGIYITGRTYGGLGGNSLLGADYDLFVMKFSSSGAQQWIEQSGVASKNISADAIAVDLSGDVFIAGVTNGSLDGNALVGTSDAFVAKYSTSGERSWSRLDGALAPTGDSFAYGVTSDSSGNTIAAGSTTGSVNGAMLTGSVDAFVVKYNAAGTPLWAQQLGSLTSITIAYAVAADASGNIFIAGSTTGGLGGNSQAGKLDLFVAKYDSSGNPLWTQQLGVASTQSQASGMTTDSAGNVYVVGSTSGNLDGNTLSGDADAFVIKYDPSGSKQASYLLGAPRARTIARGVSVSGDGSVYFAGSTTGALGGNTLRGTTDVFLAKMAAAGGASQWVSQFGVAGVDSNGFGLSLDSSGNIYLAGSTMGGFAGNSLTGLTDLFVAKFNSRGASQWIQQTGTANHNSAATGVAVDAHGLVYAAGFSDGGLSAGSTAGATNYLLVQFNSAGATQWSQQAGSGATQANALSIDTSNNVCLAGSTSGALSGNSLTGTTDLFLVKYGPSGNLE